MQHNSKIVWLAGLVFLLGMLTLFLRNEQFESSVIVPTALLLKTDQILTAESVIHDYESSLKERQFSAGYSGGYTREIQWLALDLRSFRTSDKLVLDIQPSYLDDLVIFWHDNNGQLSSHQFGDRYGFMSRLIPYRAFALPLDTPIQKPFLYLRLKTDSTSIVVVRAFNQDKFQLEKQKEYFVFALIIGFFICLLFFNVSQIVGSHDVVYRSYLYFLVVEILSLIVLNGFGSEFFLKDYPVIDDKLTPIITVLLFISICFAYLNFFGMSWQSSPVTYVMTMVGFVLGFITLLSVFLDYYVVITKYAGLYVMVLYCTWLWRGYQLSKLENKGSLWLVLASTSGLLGSISMILVLIGFLPVETVGLYAYQVGALGGVIGFQMYISSRISDAMAKREQLQIEAIQSKQQMHLEKKAREQQEVFLAMLTHELKTPLSVIRMVLDQESDKDILKQHAITSAKDIEKIINRCAQVDSFENHRFDFFNKEKIQLIEFGQSLLRENYESDPVFFRFSDSVESVEFDYSILKILILNLIENALKYGENGADIYFSLSCDSDFLIIEVTNSVGGVGPPDINKIFEKYYRSSRAHSTSGSGLGMYLVKGLTEMLGGNVSCSINDDLKKTSFIIRLPING